MSTDHHRYALVFDDGHREYVTASGPTEAVAQREGAPNSRQPHTLTDLTAMSDFVGHRGYGLRAALGLTDPSTVDDNRPLFSRSKVFSTGGQK